MSPKTIGCDIPRTWWLVLPIAFFVCRYAISLFTHKYRGLESRFLGEHGVIENMTVLVLVFATLVTLHLLYRYGQHFHAATRLCLVIYCLGCVYFAGEEASWGQHWFGWQTGEYFLAVNDQQETNFHNTHKLLDRVPKSIVSLFIFLGGVLIPIIMYRKNLAIDPGKPFWWLIPSRICLPTAIIATTATWPSKVERATDWSFYFDQAQEMKELYIAFFILLFIASLTCRVRNMVSTGQSFSPL